MSCMRKRQIVNASIDLFAKYGIAKVSVATIAKKLGVSKGMIYHYFKNGKRGLLSEILKMHEDSIRENIPHPKEWESKADAGTVLCKLFIKFPPNDAKRLRKIVRIILSEMCHNEQVALYAINHFITGREKLLAECFKVLAPNAKIVRMDFESAARIFNRFLVVCTIEDSLRYTYIENKKISEELHERTARDCACFIEYLLTL